MIEPDFLNRDIETLDIWSIERDLFLNGLSSEKRIEFVEDKLIGLILSKKADQERRGDRVKIEPFTDLERYDSGEHKGYYDRYERQWREAQSTKERIALNIFQVRNAFYSLDENFRIEFDEDFDFWFALKVSQYDFGLKHVDSFLTYQLENTFKGDKKVFIRFLKTLVLQYQGEYFTPRLLVVVNEWIDLNDISSPKGSTLLESQDDSNTEKFVPHSFMLDIIRQQPNMLNDLENHATLELLEGFKYLQKKQFLFGDVKWNEFKELFNYQKQQLETKIKWKGSLIELKWFIQEICRPGLCSSLVRGLDKWKVGKKCFLIKNNNKWTELDSYGQISNSSGSNKSKPLIEKFGQKLAAMKL